MIKDPELDDVDVLVDSKTGVHVMTKPVMIKHGGNVPYGVYYLYCPLEGVKAIREGKMPPRIPVASRAPDQFGSQEKIFANFTEKTIDDDNKNAFRYCVPMMIPRPLLMKPNLEDDSDIFIVDLTRRAQTSFMQFIAEGNKNVLEEILKEAETDSEKMMKTRLYNGLTPLFFAATFGHSEVCKLFIDNKADASFVMPESEMTALMTLAIGYIKNKDDSESIDTANYKECIKILKDAGCDVTKKNAQGDTVTDMAKKLEDEFLMAEFP